MISVLVFILSLEVHLSNDPLCVPTCLRQFFDLLGGNDKKAEDLKNRINSFSSNRVNCHSS